jgi:hypothetical protein
MSQQINPVEQEVNQDPTTAFSSRSPREVVRSMIVNDVTIANEIAIINKLNSFTNT